MLHQKIPHLANVNDAQTASFAPSCDNLLSEKMIQMVLDVMVVAMFGRKMISGNLILGDFVFDVNEDLLDIAILRRRNSMRETVQFGYHLQKFRLYC